MSKKNKGRQQLAWQPAAAIPASEICLSFAQLKAMYDISTRSLNRLVQRGELIPSQHGALRSKNYINKQHFLDLMENKRVVRKPNNRQS
jgi:hypothetical protein